MKFEMRPGGAQQRTGRIMVLLHQKSIQSYVFQNV